LRAILTVIRRLCGPVGYLHGEGLVHRDLKPANVLVRADGLPVVVDFGLTAHSGAGQGREALEETGILSGTVAYMAPEQIRTELVDARADLYSMGCILYELLAGRPPFRDASPRGVLEKHLLAQPQPPSQFVEGLPEGLDELVLRLLEKEPRARLGHASDLAAALERLGAEGGALSGPLPRAYLYRPGFAGREAVLGTLEGYLDRLDEPRGGLVLIGGESGVGKTRLALELGRKATGAGVRVLTGECSAAFEAGPGRDPFEEAALPRQEVRSGSLLGVESTRVAHSVARRSPRFRASSGRYLIA
jgi:hypothetical protein